MASAKKDLESARTTIAAAEEKAALVENTHRSACTELSTQNAQLQHDVNALKSQLLSVQTNADNFQAQVTKLTSELSERGRELAEVNEKMTQMEKEHVVALTAAQEKASSAIAAAAAATAAVNTACEYVVKFML